MNRRSRLHVDPVKVREWQQRSRERAAARARETPRKPLPRQSAKQAALEAEFDAASLERQAIAGGWCEANVPGCPPGRHVGHHAHHVRRRKGQPDVHAVEHLRWVCWPGHRWLHDHVAEARSRGLLA